MVRTAQEKRILTPDELEQVSGAEIQVGIDSYEPPCRHPNLVKTDWQREDERFIFWTQHQFAYICFDCKKLIWRDEEP